MYADGNGLYLHVASGGKSWIFRYQIEGRRRDMGLGPVDLISLAEARDRVLDLRRGIRNGVDPLEAKFQEKASLRTHRVKALTFAEAAAAYIAAHEAGWADQRSWPSTMRLYVNPVIGDLPVAAIDLPAVLRVLEPIWSSKTESAKRVRGRIEAVLDWATVRGHRSGENPARWRGHLESLLAKPSRIVKIEHHKALPYRELPTFMVQLRAHQGITAAALEFTVLTCARAGEALGATWKEIDLAADAWTIPASRMKGGREHRVPLSRATLAVLDRMVPLKRNSDDHIFIGRKSGRPLTSPALLNCAALVRPDVTVHGFRSTFRDWAAEQTEYSADLAELALAHQVGTRVERAYRRGDLLQKRRELAEAWATFCETSQGGPISRSAIGVPANQEG